MFSKQLPDLTSIGSLPIPQLKNTDGWREKIINENGEGLVSLSTINPERIDVDSRYYKDGFSSAKKECHIRETVARLLCKASETLPEGWKFVIFDAWRPLELQQQIFNKHKASLNSKRPELSKNALNQEAQKYVSLPSANPGYPSPHVSGGAVDLTLRDESGKNLEMGTEFDSFYEESHTRYLESKLESNSELTHQEHVWLENRRILFHTLTKVGFTNFPEEWWHFDYGNQFWARIKGKEAIYGITSI